MTTDTAVAPERTTSPGADTTREGEWFAVTPEWLLDADVSDRAVRLYGMLDRYADDNGRGVYPRQATLARRLRCSTSTVKRSLRELVSVGAIEIVPRFDGARQTTNEVVVHKRPPLRPVPEPPMTGGRGSHVNPSGGSHVTDRESEPEESEPEGTPPERACAREPAEPVAATTAGGSPDGQGNPDPDLERGDGSCGESPAEPDTGGGGYDVAAFVAALTVAGVTVGALRGDARAVSAFDQADAEGIPPRALAHAVEAEWPSSTRSPVGLVCYRLPGAVERLAPEYRPRSPAPTPETCPHDQGIGYDDRTDAAGMPLTPDFCVRCKAKWTPQFAADGTRLNPLTGNPIGSGVRKGVV